MVYQRTALAFILALQLNSASADNTTPPPGFPKAPFTNLDLDTAKKGELIVKLAPNARTRIERRFKRKRGRLPSNRQFKKALARQLGLRLSSTIHGNQFLVKGRRVNQKKVDRTKRKQLIRGAEKNYKILAFNNPNDFFYQFGLMWGLNNVGGFLGGSRDVDIDAPEAWQKTQGRSNVVVGVIDTGIYLKHPDLESNVWLNPLEAKNGKDDDNNGFIDDLYGWNFDADTNDPNDDHFHGTHVAGTIGARMGNNRGVAGVAPNVSLLALKVLNAKGEGDTANLIRAVEYAVDLKNRGINIKVLNASLGGGGRSPAMEEALQRANKAGIVFVAAAGNNSTDNDVEPVFPATYPLPNVISVGALDNSGQLADFSNYGERSVHVLAPGVNIWSTIVFNFYLPFSGTSMAAPHVAGIAALMLSEEPTIKPVRVRDRIMNSIKPLPHLQGAALSPGIVSASNSLN